MIGVGGLIALLAGVGGGTFLALSKVRPEVAKMAEERRAAAEAARLAEEERARAALYVRLPDPAHLDPEHLRSVARELERWNADLAKREQRIVEAETSVARREEIVRQERSALDQQRREIAEFQRSVANSVVLIEERTAAALTQQVEMLNAMKPEQVVDFLKEQTDARAAKMLAQMKTRRVVKLMETWTGLFPEDRTRVLGLFEKMRLVMNEGDLAIRPAPDAEAAPPPTP